MSDLVTIDGQKVVTSSRSVAEHFEKEHAKVIRSIETIMSETPKMAFQKMFFETTYKVDGNNKSYKEYLMNRDGFSLLVMGFTGAKALAWKLRYIEAFNAMEKEIALPKVTPNPHYRTRMVGTAIQDVMKTAKGIEQMTAVKHGIALAAAMQMISKSYGVDMEPVKALLPSEDVPSYLTPTKIAERAGILNKKGTANAQAVNKMLETMGLQKKESDGWHLLEKGKAYGEEMPFVNNGHSGYRINWSEKVLGLFEEGESVKEAQ